LKLIQYERLSDSKRQNEYRRYTEALKTDEPRGRCYVDGSLTLLNAD